MTTNNQQQIEQILKQIEELRKVVLEMKEMKIQSDIPEHLKNADDYTFTVACKDGKIDDVKIMLTMKYIDFTYNSNVPLRLATKYGHIEIVKLLLEESKKPESKINFSVCCNTAIYMALDNGHIEIIKLLIDDPKFDPCYDDCNLFKWSIEFNHKELTMMLLDHPKIKAKLME